MAPERVAVVGAGRVGRALTDTLAGSDGPFGRGFDGLDVHGSPYDIVILAVPDAEIRSAARALRATALVGHCSGALGLDTLRPHEAFGVHPLMTFTADNAAFAGAAAAVGGATPRALATAHRLADSLGMHSFEIRDNDRAAYHAAATIASNYLVTVEAAAETLMSTAVHEEVRPMLGPLVRATVDNWLRVGAARALTGPIARGDADTVARQRAAVAEAAPQLLALFDALTDATRALVGEPQERR